MTHPRSSIRLSLALAVAGLLVVGCAEAGAGSGPPVPPKVAFFEDLSIPDTLDTVLPAFMSMGAYLRAETDAGRTPSFQVVAFDTQGDPAIALENARTVASDPTFVAAVIAPFLVEPSSVAAALSDAGIPVLNLSAVGVPPSASAGADAWVSLVAGLPAQAAALADLASGEAGTETICEGGDDTAWARLVARGVAAAAPEMHPALLPTDTAAAARATEDHRCHVILWTGYAPDAQDLRAVVPSSIDMVGADGMKTYSYLTAAPIGTSSSVACSCADVNTSTRPTVQTFINGYQVATGLTPGVYAAEAWDASGILGTLTTPGADRASVRAGLEGTRSYRGVATSYRFDPPTPVPARDFHGVGSRWITSVTP